MAEEIINQHNTAYIPLTKHRRKMIRLALIAAVIVLTMVGIFVYYTVRMFSGGRVALREAKNIRLAMVSADLEAYAAGQSIYAPERAEGLSNGTHEKIDFLADINGELRLTSYNKATRQITGFTYKKSRYLVTFSVGEQGEENWRVDYLLPIMDY